MYYSSLKFRGSICDVIAQGPTISRIVFLRFAYCLLQQFLLSYSYCVYKGKHTLSNHQNKHQRSLKKTFSTIFDLLQSDKRVFEIRIWNRSCRHRGMMTNLGDGTPSGGGGEMEPSSKAAQGKGLLFDTIFPVT